jgi:hypothetical protein
MATDEKQIDKKKVAERRIGFYKKNIPYKGVDPKTGERMSVVLEELNKEFGVKEGVAKYYASANLEGESVNPQTGETITGRYFFDPEVEKNYRPDLVVASLPEAVRAKVDEILSTPQLKEQENDDSNQ